MFKLKSFNLRRITRIVTIFVLLMMIWAAAAPAAFGQHDVHAVLVPAAARKPAPGFYLIAENGRKSGIADYRGKVVLLNFWATDCGGCILEIPSFIQLQAAYGSKGFTALGVSMDLTYENLKNAQEAWGKVRPFIVSHRVNYPVIMGNSTISAKYKLTEYPDTFLIDKSGRIAAAYVGVVNKDDVETNIRKLLAEPRGHSLAGNAPSHTLGM